MRDDVRVPADLTERVRVGLRTSFPKKAEKGSKGAGKRKGPSK